MRKVSIRQFRANIKHELSLLPLVVTSKGKPLAMVVPYLKGVHKDEDKSSNVYTSSKPKKRIFNAMLNKYVEV